MSTYSPPFTEWLETDGKGGYAMGTSDLVPRRRYHSLLTSALTPPTHRATLLNGLDVTVNTASHSYSLSSFQFWSSTVTPNGRDFLHGFTSQPWPTYTFQLPEGLDVTCEVVMPHGVPAVVLRWRLTRAFQHVSNAPGTQPRLLVRPLLSAREHHSLHATSEEASLESAQNDALTTWRLYDSTPKIIAATAAEYQADPVWYYGFSYSEDQARGYEGFEDLASPGEFSIALSDAPAAIIFTSSLAPQHFLDSIRTSPGERAEALIQAEATRRRDFSSSLLRSADSYIVERGSLVESGNGKSILAGYPWFTDWGRDTCIAVRGLCLATGRFADAREILLRWSQSLSEGMLPNVFPDGQSSTALYNSVDAALWFVIAASELIKKGSLALTTSDATTLREAMTTIVSNYASGTRFRIKVNDDGLLSAGVRGTQLTWMDAKYRDITFTPRVGKPVEIQALWINALLIVEEWSDQFTRLRKLAQESFHARFWNPERRCLYDVVDVNHQNGTFDPKLRPNQIFAVGGLPYAVVSGERARQLLTIVERQLVTPHGVRTLEPADPDYHGLYRGSQFERDSAYHQGTAWVWLLGPFVEAWVRVHLEEGKSDKSEAEIKEIKTQAYKRFLEPVVTASQEYFGGHLPELADGSYPFLFQGSPFQAWSVGEVIRVMREVLG